MSNKPTLKQFNKLVNNQLKEWKKSKRKKGEKVTKQGLATKRGNLIEDVAANLLQNHPNKKDLDVQIFEEDVDEFSRIDIVFTTKNNNKVYIPVARDLWLGTTQQDRLQIQVYKYKSGICDKFNYSYLVGDSFEDYVNEESTKKARKKKTVQKWVKKLHEKNMLHTFDTLWEHLKTL